MSEAKFTPGPWMHNPQFPTSVWAGDVWIGSANVETVPSLDERTANARMFAAAKAMYEALMDLSAHLDFSEPVADNTAITFADASGINAAFEKAYAALAKARGEAQ